MEEVNGLLETVDGVTAVHARYYDLCSSFHKVGSATDAQWFNHCCVFYDSQVKADHGAYYRDALRYLGCVDISSMSGKLSSPRLSTCINKWIQFA